MDDTMIEANPHPVTDGRPTVVIAGGSGFIGRRLSAVLGSGGYQVVILSRAAPRPPVGPVRFARWPGAPVDAGAPADPGALANASGEESWPQCLEGAHAVVNLCGEPIGGPRWTASRKAALISSRVEPTRTLIDAVNAAASPPELFVQASGVGYYGTGSQPCTEAATNGRDFLADLADQWEAPLAALRQDTRPVIIRLGVVLAKQGGALAQMLLPFRLFVGGPIASGNQWFSWIHLHDAAVAIASLIDDRNSRGFYNVTAPKPVSNAEFARAAGESLRRPSWMFTPRVLLKALLGEQSTLVCDGQRALPERLQQAGFTFTYPTIEALFESLT